MCLIALWLKNSDFFFVFCFSIFNRNTNVLLHLKHTREQTNKNKQTKFGNNLMIND